MRRFDPAQWLRPAWARRFGFGDSLAQGLGVLFSNGLILTASFFSGVILARTLGPEGKGTLATALVFPTLLASVFQMGIRQATVYEIGRKQLPPAQIMGAVGLLFLIFSLGGALTSYALSRLVSGDALTGTMAGLAAVLIPTSLITAYSGGFMIGQQRIGLSNVMQVLPPFLQLAGVVLLVYLLELGVVGALVAAALAALTASGCTLSILSRHIPLRVGWEPAAQLRLLRLGWVYALALFLNQLNYRIGVVMLQRLSTLDQVGQYSIGVNVSELLWQIPSAIGIVLFSRSANQRGSAAFQAKVWRVFQIGMGLALLGAIGLGVASEWVIPWVYGADFLPSVRMLQYLLPGVVAMVGYRLLSFDLAGKGRPWPAVYAAVPGVLLNVILNLAWIPKYGGQGAAVAASLGYSLMAGVYFVLYLEHSRRLAEPPRSDA